MQVSPPAPPLTGVAGQLIRLMPYSAGLGRAERPQNLGYGQNVNYSQTGQASLAHLLQNPQLAQLRHQASQLNQQAPANTFTSNPFNFSQVPSPRLSSHEMLKPLI